MSHQELIIQYMVLGYLFSGGREKGILWANPAPDTSVCEREIERGRSDETSRLWYDGRPDCCNQTLCWLKLKILNQNQKNPLMWQKNSKIISYQVKTAMNKNAWKKQSGMLLLPQEHLSEGTVSLGFQLSDCREETLKPVLSGGGSSVRRPTLQAGALEGPPSVGGRTRRNELHPPQR